MPKLDHIHTAPQKILILGANGQLGQAFAHMFEAKFALTQQGLAGDCVETKTGHIPLGSNQASAQNPNKYKRINELILTLPGPSQGGPDLSTEQGLQALERYLLSHRPSLVINAVAYTAVDQAEQELDKAYQLNTALPERLVKILAQWQGRLIHFSTDYVFNPKYDSTAFQGDTTKRCVVGDGVESFTPYHDLSKCTEDAVAEPINTYGLSKLAGEQAVMQSGLSLLLIRTSWLYSKSGHNFFTIMRRLMQSQEQVTVVNDQWGVPSSVDFVARYTWALQQQGAQGLFHVVPDGVCTWFEFAHTIAKELKAVGEDLRVTEILAQTYQQYQTQRQQVAKMDAQSVKRVADRPAYAVLDNTKLKRTLGLAELTSWQESLQELVQS